MTEDVKTICSVSIFLFCVGVAVGILAVSIFPEQCDYFARKVTGLVRPIRELMSRFNNKE